MSSYERFKKQQGESFKPVYVSENATRRMFELIDCMDYDDRKGKLDPLTKHRKDQLKEALKNEAN